MLVKKLLFIRGLKNDELLARIGFMSLKKPASSPSPFAEDDLVLDIRS
jgi:hypothetical protein